MEYQPREELEKTLERAKCGDAKASQELLSHHCKVWTHEELQALNVYRKGRDAERTYPQEKSISTFYCKKNFLSKPELTTVVWCQEFDAQYDLYCLKFSDGIKQLWMFKRGKPICNVTDWSKRDINQEGRPSTKGKKLSKTFFKPKN